MSGVLVLDRGDVHELTRSAAEILTGELRAALKNAAEWAARAAELIEQAWAMRADQVLGYPTWGDYCEDCLAGVRQYKIPAPQRQELVTALIETGMSGRKVSAAVGISEGQVRLDLKAAQSALTPAPEDDVTDAELVMEDAGTIIATSVTPRRKTKSNNQRVLDALAASGEDGVTSKELRRRLRLIPDPGAILSELHGIKGGQRVARLSVNEPTGTREAYAVYVLPQHVAGREVEGPGRRVRRKASA
ncbi:hypothetical protein [Enterococcus hirae]|uniref:hypothetical protein n=1 Tax=Enterococcus hirae TaxID=1354 RepID=UPI001369D3CA|nr:hypothetical protein [Enterococcus hirae]NAE18235.1 hypothetical protein [Enterococcus hirae]